MNAFFRYKDWMLGALGLIFLGLIIGAVRPKRVAGASGSPPIVEVVEIQQKDVPVYREWIGTLDGLVTAGALRGNLQFAKSQYQQALIAYRQAIQRAFGDVSDALIDYQKLRQVRLRQEDTVVDLRESVRLSNDRFAGGTTTFLEILDGQRSLFSAELTLAQPRGSEYQSLVQLYKALGGGWKQQLSFDALAPESDLRRVAKQKPIWRDSGRIKAR